jgi:hypothetical protein
LPFDQSKTSRRAPHVASLSPASGTDRPPLGSFAQVGRQRGLAIELVGDDLRQSSELPTIGVVVDDVPGHRSRDAPWSRPADTDQTDVHHLINSRLVPTPQQVATQRPVYTQSLTHELSRERVETPVLALAEAPPPQFGVPEAACTSAGATKNSSVGFEMQHGRRPWTARGGAGPGGGRTSPVPERPLVGAACSQAMDGSRRRRGVDELSSFRARDTAPTCWPAHAHRAVGRHAGPSRLDARRTVIA